MRFVECLLYRMKPAVLGKALNRRDLMTISLDGEHQARAHRFAVEEHGTGTADAVFTPHVRPGEGKVVAQEVTEQQARFDAAPERRAVDRHRYGCRLCLAHVPRS